MNASRLLPWILSLVLVGLSSRCLASDALAAVELWPKGAPGEQGGSPEEKDTTKASDGKVAGRSVIRLGNVSKPTLTVYQPAPDQATGTAVLVCPGGAYNILAMSQDDPVRVENAIFYALALKKVSGPCELHLYPSGGHGYGLRESKHLVTTWPARAEEWMRSRDSLSRRPGAP